MIHPSPSDLIDDPLDPPEPEMDPSRHNPRWLCINCGDLALLDLGGRCRNCRPERVLTFSEVCARVVSGERGAGGGREKMEDWLNGLSRNVYRV